MIGVVGKIYQITTIIDIPGEYTYEYEPEPGKRPYDNYRIVSSRGLLYYKQLRWPYSFELLDKNWFHKQTNPFIFKLVKSYEEELYSTILTGSIYD